ncbi:MAG: Gmad2 immunoglobulin-like domain-containing protein, partial [Patescibacteria group bacterium]
MEKKIMYTLTAMAFVIVALTGVLLWPVKTNNNGRQQEQEKTGLVIFLPKPNDLISSPLKIEGYVNGDGWIGFEAQVGIVKLFDANGKELALGLLTAKDQDWMKVKIDFHSQLNFQKPESTNGLLVFYNENPSGEPERSKTFTLPVKFK